MKASGAMPSAPFAKTVSGWRERLQAAMDERNLSARKLALRADLNPGAISEWLNPKKQKQPSFQSLAAVAKVLGVSVSLFAEDGVDNEPELGNDISPSQISYATVNGELEAGIWREPTVYVVDDATLIPAVPHPDFIGIKQYAWRVCGNSMNLLVAPGAYVIGISFHDIWPRRELRDGDVVVCERRDGDKVECTLKRVAKDGDRFRLDAESDDDRFKKPVWISADEDGEEVSVQATYLIIGSFRFLS